MQKKKIAVIGLGDFGRCLVKALYRDRHEVTAIDRDMNTIEYISEFCTAAVCLDSRDEKALRSQGLEDMDMVILASAESFESLIVTADNLKSIGVREIHARYRTDLHTRILHMLGIHNLYNPEEEAARNIAERFGHKGIEKSLFLTNEYIIDEVITPRELIGKSVLNSGLKDKFNLSLVTIKRQRKTMREEWDEEEPEIIGIPSQNTIFEKDDTLVLFGSHEDMNRFLELHHI